MSRVRTCFKLTVCFFLVYSAGNTTYRNDAPSTSAEDPSISPGGILNCASYEPGMAPSAWVSVFGSNLAASARAWNDADFSGDALPTTLDGVSVRINGTAGYLSYVSPTQINVLVPDDGTEGDVQVQVFTGDAASQPVHAIKQNTAPALFMFYSGGYKYAAAVHTDGILAAPPELFPGVTARPSEPGETIMIFGNGFGATNPVHPTSQLVRNPVPLALPANARIGGQPADVAYAGLVAPGLYQFNVIVPDITDGDQPIVLEVGGRQTQSGPVIAVKRTRSAPSGAIVVDHRNTDITKIPDSWIARARENLKLYYGHTSHGTQITNGLLRVESELGVNYAVAASGQLPSRSGALAILEAGTYDWDPDFYPTVPRILSANPSINVVMYMWCSQPGGLAWETLLDTYIAGMQALERQYPRVTFVYATGQAQDKDCGGCIRQRFNERLRQFVLANNKVLFDFGDLDAWYDGKMQTYSIPNWCGTYGCNPGASIPTEHAQWGGGDYNNPCGHATYASCDNKGRAMWWLLARIASWNGVAANSSSAQ